MNRATLISLSVLALTVTNSANAAICRASNDRNSAILCKVNVPAADAGINGSFTIEGSSGLWQIDVSKPNNLSFLWENLNATAQDCLGYQVQITNRLHGLTILTAELTDTTTRDLFCFDN